MRKFVWFNKLKIQSFKTYYYIDVNNAIQICLIAFKF